MCRQSRHQVNECRRDAGNQRKKEENNYQNRFRLSLRQHHPPQFDVEEKRAPSTSSSQEKERETNTHTTQGGFGQSKLTIDFRLLFRTSPPPPPPPSPFISNFSYHAAIDDGLFIPPTISSYFSLKFFFLNARTHTHKSKRRARRRQRPSMSCLFTRRGRHSLDLFFIK